MMYFASVLLVLFSLSNGAMAQSSEVAFKKPGHHHKHHKIVGYRYTCWAQDNYKQLYIGRARSVSRIQAKEKAMTKALNSCVDAEAGFCDIASCTFTPIRK